MLGEAAHNLRSALDNLVSVLVLRNGKTPAHSNAFPVCRKPSAWHRDIAEGYPTGGPLANVSRTDFELLENLSPTRASTSAETLRGRSGTR